MAKKEIEIIEETVETREKFHLPTGEVMTLNEYLVWLGNRIINIEGAVC